MIYPSGGPAPLPHPDLPDDIKEDYEKARSIVSRSPRSVAALLRLAVDKLLDWIIEEKTYLKEIRKTLTLRLNYW
jgi:hypothetical protein